MPSNPTVDENFAPGVKSPSPTKLASTLSKFSGDNQSASYSTNLINAIEVIVKDQAGDPYAGATIQFAILTGGGSISASSVVTNSSGVASTSWTLGSTLGSQTLSASTTGGTSPTSVTFSATATAGTTSAANSTLSFAPATVANDGATQISLTATLKDGAGNAISGKTVTLTSSRGATDTITPASGTSNASGQVSFTVTSVTTGKPTLTATDTTSSVTIAQTAKVQFFAASPTYEYLVRLFDAYNTGSNTSSLKASWKNLSSLASSYDGTLNNFAFTTASGWTGDGATATTGVADGPYRLMCDGTDDYVAFGTGPNSTNSTTFEAWVRPTASGGLAKAIVSNGQTTNSGTTTETNVGLTIKQSQSNAGKVDIHLGERSYQDEVMADSPWLYYRFDETSGANAVDSSGNARNGEFVGGVKLGESTALSGSDGYSVRLNGQRGRIHATFPTGFSSYPYTVSLWVKISTYVNPSATMLYWDTAGYFILDEPTTLPQFWSAGWRSASAGNEVAAGTWKHLALVATAASTKLYVNGTEALNSANLVSATAGNEMFIGVRTDAWGPGYSLNGWIDEFAIFSTGLSQARIQAHYYAGIKRLGCQSTTIMSSGTWYFLNGTFDSTGPTLKLFVNGSQECSATLAGAAYTGSTNDLRLGRDQSATNSWNGSVSELRTYSSALSSGNVSTHYSTTNGSYPAASSSTFSPTDLQGLVMWYKAESLSAQADGSAVSSWSDSSGRGYTLTQAAGGSQPTYESDGASTINGYGVVRFSITKYLDSTADSFPNGAARSHFVVIKNGTDTGQTSIIIHSGGWNSSVTGFCTAFRGGTAFIEGNHFCLSSNANDNTTSQAVTNSLILIEHSYDGFTDTVRVNGTSKGTVTVALNTDFGAASNKYRIGANGAAGNPFVGDIAEILIYNYSLSAAQRTNVESYLNTKYVIW